MTEPVNPEDRKHRLLSVFRDIAPTYDALFFLQATARRLLEKADISSGARLLDVATGTGIVAMSAAEVVGPKGSVVGVDLSSDMLALARQKSAAAGYTNIEFREGDAQKLDFPDGSFDAVLCASSLFFIPDMLSVMKESRRVLAPRGRVGFNSFELNFLQPFRDLWSTCLQRHGLKIGALPIQRLANAAMCEQLLNEAGFTDIDVSVEQLGYFLPTAEERWNDIAAGLEGLPILALPPEQREQLKAEHLAELKALITPKGIWVDVPVILAFGS